MCGRFTLAADTTTLTETFPGLEISETLPQRYNITPSQEVAVISNTGENKLDLFYWGLIPSWAKDPKIGNRMINARGETVAEKPSFRAAYKRRRCLVLADGYYEWRKEEGSRLKTPIYIRLKSEKPFAFAGLWEAWRPPGEDESVHSCTIITCPPNAFMEQIHHRMPVILPPDAYSLWLEPLEQTADTLNPLLKAYPADEMTAYAVSRFVNRPQNDSPDCIAPAQSGELSLN
jgi:putative SOS response-associated peptidase YedK